MGTTASNPHNLFSKEWVGYYSLFLLLRVFVDYQELFNVAQAERFASFASPEFVLIIGNVELVELC